MSQLLAQHPRIPQNFKAVIKSAASAASPRILFVTLIRDSGYNAKLRLQAVGTVGTFCNLNLQHLILTERAGKLLFVSLGALREAIFKSIAAHMAQHGHTWHDLCTFIITYVTTCECHDHTLHNFCMHMITHGTTVALTLHSTATNDTTWAQMHRHSQ